ncbi:peptidoglycan recognition protein family protein [Clostridium tetani]|uniref:peptidoglycan recognition protein family protein n=1 Tax=Clostridium tetani TaxID=1513 RepID=UPI002953547E|nr:peptidoglycan recognition family protein [Clostridium tetani]BDR64410.1 hypothetical protein K134307016_13440 [Clostridium tetani]
MKIKKTNLKFRGILSNRSMTKYIIYHHAEHPNCSVYDIHNWHLHNGWSGIGYNFFVKKDGSIWRGRPIDAMGAHTMGYNDISIGICAEGKYMCETMPQVQKKALIELGIYLKNKYNIDTNNIIGHRDVNSTTCPGRLFPLEEIKQSILKGKVPTINNSYINIDGGGYANHKGRAPGINLIIKDFSRDIERVFAWVDNDKGASWAFDLTPPNSNYTTLFKNTSKVITKRNGGYTFSKGSIYKINVKGYDRKGKVVASNQIVLKVPR